MASAGDHVRGDEPGQRLGVGADGLGGLALGGRVQPERADLAVLGLKCQVMRMWMWDRMPMMIQTISPAMTA